MLTDTQIEQLRYKGEGSDLDYKSERYPFEKATDEQKSELLKDILALANTHRDGTAFILIGFKENAPHPADVIGLAPDGAIDDSRLQEFVNSKLESKLQFRYEERLFDKKQIAVISIPKQQRPFYLKKDYGKLTKDIVYVRRGSSTGIASPREIAMMGSVNSQRSAAKVQLHFHTDENQVLPNKIERRFPFFAEDLPNYEAKRDGFMPTLRSENRHFWRELARFYYCWQRAIQIRLTLVNNSDFSLSDARLEVICRPPDAESIEILRAAELPDEPEATYLSPGLIGPSVIDRIIQHQMSVDIRGIEPVANIELGTIRPGQSIRAEDDVAIVPSNPGRYILQVRILASEIPSPMVLTHEFDITGEVENLTAEMFLSKCGG